MSAPILLELALRRAGAGGYAAALELRRAGAAPAQLVAEPLPEVQIDAAALLEVALDPPAYGGRLAAMLFAAEPLRLAFARARAAATSAGAPLHLRLRLPADDAALNTLAWETLADPEGGGPIGLSERLLVARALDSPDLGCLPPRPAGDLRVVLAAASPSDLPAYGLAPVAVDGLAARCATAPLKLSPLGLPLGAGPATPEALRAALATAPDILVLICHGTLVDGRPWLWLEGADGRARRVAGEELAQALAELPERPALVVLASCHSAGEAPQPGDGALAAVGPLLARAGVLAVVAMRGLVSQQSVASFVPTLVSALAADGRVDRAVAAARAALGQQPDRWAPVLFARVEDGQLWDTATPATEALSPLERRNRELMLTKVREFWVAGVLDWAFTLVPRIELRLEERPDRVQSALDELVARSTHPGRAAHAVPDIAAAYDTSAGGLLIMGEPGAGKTFQMLELARRLLERAEADQRQPIPVVVNLATWAARRQRLADWLVEELRQRYSVPRAVGLAWLAEERVALLLDGLDEVPRGLRTACAKAINAHRAAYNRTPVVVCCRSADYAELRARLALARAVEVRPLSDAQLRAYLQHDAAGLPALAEAIAGDEALGSLAESPLMLNLMRLVYEDAAGAATLAAAGPQERRPQLLRAFVERGLHHSPRRRPIAAPQLRRWMGWLARGMLAHNQTTFYLDQLQPSWLAGRGQRWLYAALAGLLGGVLGLTVSTVVLSICFGADFGLVYGPLYGLCFAVGGALQFGLDDNMAQISSAERLDWSWEHFRSALREAMRWFPQVALLFALVIGLSFYIRLRGVLLGTLVFGVGSAVLFGLGTAIFFALGSGLVPVQQLGAHTVPAEGVKRAARNMVLIGIPAGLALGLGGGLIFGGLGDLSFLMLGRLEQWLDVPIISDGRGPVAYVPWLETRVGVAFVLIGALLLLPMRYGGETVSKHLALRCVLALSGRLPWRMERFLDECEERTLMRRIGGGYAFIHRMFLEHFAEQEA